MNLSRPLAFFISLGLPLLALLPLGILEGATVYAQALGWQPADRTFSAISGTAVLLPLAGREVPPLSVLLSPVHGAIVTETETFYFDWDNGGATVVSYTLMITGEDSFSGLTLQGAATVTATGSSYTPTQILPNGLYTWTVQAHDLTGEVSGYPEPFTFTVQAMRPVYLPWLVADPPLCPPASSAAFQLIPIEGNPTDRPDFLHGDLNLAQRGYNETIADMTLKDFPGATDPGAPQLAGLFNPNSFPGIIKVYRVNGWDWGCGVHGCPTGPISDPLVTLMALKTTPGQPIYIPERDAAIYPGDYKVMVLYAAETRITLGYTRRDTVADGYAVHLEDVCVDPNLLALYRAQIGPDGYRIRPNGIYQLPALRSNQALGTALNEGIGVAIRDRGSFLDPRSRKDWWRGF